MGWFGEPANMDNFPRALLVNRICLFLDVQEFAVGFFSSFAFEASGVICEASYLPRC
jgi:hypothetical protein